MLILSEASIILKKSLILPVRLQAQIQLKDKSLPIQKFYSYSESGVYVLLNHNYNYDWLRGYTRVQYTCSISLVVQYEYIKIRKSDEKNT